MGALIPRSNKEGMSKTKNGKEKKTKIFYFSRFEHARLNILIFKIMLVEMLNDQKQ